MSLHHRLPPPYATSTPIRGSHLPPHPLHHPQAMGFSPAAAAAAAAAVALSPYGHTPPQPPRGPSAPPTQPPTPVTPTDQYLMHQARINARLAFAAAAAAGGNNASHNSSRSGGGGGSVSASPVNSSGSSEDKSSSSGETPMSRTNQYKKIMKPLLERKRRARINKCLDELKDIMTVALQAQGENVSKLEKADILELTVRHLQKLQQSQRLLPRNPLEEVQRFQAGYTSCAQEAASFLLQSPGVDVRVSQRLLSHLTSTANLAVQNPFLNRLAAAAVATASASPSAEEASEAAAATTVSANQPLSPAASGSSVPSPPLSAVGRIEGTTDTRHPPRPASLPSRSPAVGGMFTVAFRKASSSHEEYDFQEDEEAEEDAEEEDIVDDTEAEEETSTARKVAPLKPEAIRLNNPAGCSEDPVWRPF